MAFDWWTGDKESIGEESAPDGPRTWKPGWSYMLALSLLLLVGAVGFFLWHRSQEQIREVTTTITADVLSSYDLAQRAATMGDEELLVTVLSGRDRAWTAAQRQRLRKELLFGQAARVFGLHPTSSLPAVVDVTLSPDLRVARVLTTQSYTVALGRNLTQTVTLSQTLTFRHGRQRWLYSPPDEAFWGKVVTVHDERLSLTFPNRDRDAAVALTVDLNRDLEQMCATTWVTCPDGRLVAVRLDRDPESVLRLAETDVAMNAGEEVVLPTPSLVGWPAGEAACQALYRGYASHVLALTASELLGYQCCQKALFHQALLDRLLSELGMRPWPLKPEDYLRFAENPAPMGRMDDFWRRPGIGSPPTDDERLQARAFVTFLEAVYGARSEEQHRLLLEAEGFWGWMRAISGVAVGQEEAIGEAWHRFLADPRPRDLYRHFVDNEASQCPAGAWVNR